MKIIIPMAGMGKRMRPHTLSIPKPLITIAGKPIVQRLVEDIVEVLNEEVEEIAFIIGDFGTEVEQQLLGIAESLNTKGSIYYQKEALGTGHAIYCAAESLSGNITVAFADTLFKADFKLDSSNDGIIWTHKVEDPSAYGVVKKDGEGYITTFVEKPVEFVSNEAIIGIYYFRDGDQLRDELKYLLDNDIRTKGEYQLTDALQSMMEKGNKFVTGAVEEWHDCGNKNATVHTHQRTLINKLPVGHTDASAQLKNSVIIQPCFIGENVVIEDSVVGPYVSVEANSQVQNSLLKNTMVQQYSRIQNANIANSMIGHHVELKSQPREMSLGDYNVIEQ